MKRSFLARLRSNGLSYLCAGLLLLAGIPAYQTFILAPLGYNNALTATSAGNSGAYLAWIDSHQLSFLLYRVLLLLAFVLLLSLPFSLFRIIIAQELMGQEEREKEELLEEEEDTDDTDDTEEETEAVEDVEDEDEDETEETEGMPPYAWRGKGFAVLAAWSGIIGLTCYLVGTLASTLYLSSISNGIAANAPLSGSNTILISIFAILTNTVGIGLLALSTLFFGAVIARSGTKLWPSAWVIFGYIALAVAALFSGTAVSVASAPASGQAPLAAPAILLFGVWALWLGIMLVRLKPEPIITA